MSYPKLVVAFLFFISLNSSAQLIGGPEKIAKKFLKAAGKGDFEKAASYCILELREDMDRNARRNKSGNEFEIETINCEVKEIEYGVDCSCTSEMRGERVMLIYSMTEIDGNWKIYNIEFDNLGYEGNGDEKNDSNKKIESPQDALNKFAEYSLAKNHKKASAITIMGALKDYLSIVEKNPGALPVRMSNIFCHKADEKTECNCDQVTADGTSESAFYELIFVDGKWKILEFGTTRGAEYVARRFVTNLANGDCALALQMATGVAAESVQGSIDAGCTSYSTKILSVNCIYEDDSAFCTCVENRDGMEMTFEYDMVNEGGRWLITKYQKDFDLESTETIYQTDSTATIEVMDYSDYGTPDQQETIVAIPDVEAEFPGGNAALVTYMKDNVVYPESAKNSAIEGTVYIQFVVRTDGTITNVVVIKGVNKELDEEAMRVVNSMPKWTPGKVQDQVVSTYYTLPIRFELNK